MAFCAHDLGVATLAGDPGSPIHRLDPRAKVLGVAGVILVAVSAPVQAWPVYAACAALLVAVAVVARVGADVIWRRSRFVLPLVLFVAAFVPFARSGEPVLEIGPLTISDTGLETFAAAAAKATIGTIAAVLLGATTAFPDVLRALRALKVPKAFVLIAHLTYRYLFVVVAEVRRMRTALAARAYRPRSALQAGALGRAAGALFVRSHARGERVYLAMAARGFRGTLPEAVPLRWHAADAVVLAAVGGLVALRVAIGVAA